MRVRETTIISTCLAALAVIVMCGCAPKVSVQSSLGVDYEINLSRVFVVLETHEIEGMTRFVEDPGAEFGTGVSDTVTFASRFLRELDESFDALDVEYQSYLGSSAELNDAGLSDRVKQFKADAVLWISEEDIKVTRASEATSPFYTDLLDGITLEAVILNNLSDQQIIWSASIEADTGLKTWRSMAQDSASALVDQLVADGLIKSGHSR